MTSLSSRAAEQISRLRLEMTRRWEKSIDQLHPEPRKQTPGPSVSTHALRTVFAQPDVVMTSLWNKVPARPGLWRAISYLQSLQTIPAASARHLQTRQSGHARSVL